ncbi:uncharacterized protein [Triticum aestivum]|uniref:uncharacterized protein n=1 Tax=Triticum aestivum TaxID=4565 RepID=UPI001D005810|nr:uncharacterized protein LOC123076253 [Triticum aestivum]
MGITMRIIPVTPRTTKRSTTTMTVLINNCVSIVKLKGKYRDDTTRDENINSSLSDMFWPSRAWINLRPYSISCSSGTPYVGKTPRGTSHPFSRFFRSSHASVRAEPISPGAPLPPLFAGRFRRQSQQHERDEPVRLHRAATGYVVATARRGRPATVEHHHHLRRSPPHTYVASPSPETRRRSAAADIRAAAAVFPHSLIVRSATRAIVRSVTF